MARTIFLSALDEAHTYAAIRYVERNPVEARLVDKAEDYIWSSPAHHCGLVDSKALMNRANNVVGVAKTKWSAWLAVVENKIVTDVLARNVEKGLACGSESFIDRLERLTKRSLRYRPQGRPTKEA